MSWLDQVLMELSRPDDFGRDWYGWATNQMAHVLLGVLFTAISLVFFPKVYALLFILLFATGKELYDLNNGGAFKDSFNDWSFMVVGGVLCTGLWDKDQGSVVFSIFVISLGLLLGIMSRLKSM